MPEPLLAITGGAGRIATALRPLLGQHYRLRLLDVRPPAEDPGSDELDFRHIDVTGLADMESALAGATAVLHLAANPSTSASWPEVRGDNIEATFSVFEAARRRGARKVVFASTNHVMGFYNLDQAWPVGSGWPVRPDSLYGVSKAFGEALARYYADAFEMSMICLRIGWFTPQRPERRQLAPLWISARDLAQIVQLSLDTPRRFGIYNATSDNPQQQWDLQSARDELGYAPQDSVSQFLPDAAADAPPAPGPVGEYVNPQAGILRGAPRSSNPPGESQAVRE